VFGPRRPARSRKGALRGAFAAASGDFRRLHPSSWC